MVSMVEVKLDAIKIIFLACSCADITQLCSSEKSPNVVGYKCKKEKNPIINKETEMVFKSKYILKEIILKFVKYK